MGTPHLQNSDFSISKAVECLTLSRCICEKCVLFSHVNPSACCPQRRATRCQQNTLFFFQISNSRRADGVTGQAYGVTKQDCDETRMMRDGTRRRKNVVNAKPSIPNAWRVDQSVSIACEILPRERSVTPRSWAHYSFLWTNWYLCWKMRLLLVFR